MSASGALNLLIYVIIFVIIVVVLLVVLKFFLGLLFIAPQVSATFMPYTESMSGFVRTSSLIADTSPLTSLLFL
jgi:hypothetical protein